MASFGKAATLLQQSPISKIAKTKKIPVPVKPWKLKSLGSLAAQIAKKALLRYTEKEILAAAQFVEDTYRGKKSTRAQRVGTFFEYLAQQPNRRQLWAFRKDIHRSGIGLMLLNIVYPSEEFYIRASTSSERTFFKLSLKDVPFKKGFDLSKHENILAQLQKEFALVDPPSDSLSRQLDKFLEVLESNVDDAKISRLEHTSISGSSYVDAMDVLELTDGRRLALLFEEFKFGYSRGEHAQIGAILSRLFSDKIADNAVLEFRNANGSEGKLDVKNLVINMTSEATMAMATRSGGLPLDEWKPGEVTKSVMRKRGKHVKKKKVSQPGVPEDFGYYKTALGLPEDLVRMLLQ